MKRRIAFAVACLLVAQQSAFAQDTSGSVGDAAVQNQWYTGPLEAPSPALPRAGLVAIEPYAIFINNTGAYNNKGRHVGMQDQADPFESMVLFKYGITNRLSVQALPSLMHLSNHEDHVTGMGDLPVELEYRFNDGNSRTGWPSMTASLGVTLPSGHYQRLQSPLDGLGGGAYMLKEGLLFQSRFDTYGHHPVRIRVYGAAYEPMNRSNVNDISSYGTAEGFHGHVVPGFSANVGIGAEYGLSQRWVLALDLVENYSKGFHTVGHNANGNAIDARSPSDSSSAIAPAIEYNWSANAGVIAGVEFAAGGRNSDSYVAPQVALMLSF